METAPETTSDSSVHTPPPPPTKSESSPIKRKRALTPESGGLPRLNPKKLFGDSPRTLQRKRRAYMDRPEVQRRIGEWDEIKEETFQELKRRRLEESSEGKEEDNVEVSGSEESSDYEMEELRNEVTYLEQKVRKIEGENFKLRRKIRSIRNVLDGIDS